MSGARDATVTVACKLTPEEAAWLGERTSAGARGDWAGVSRSKFLRQLLRIAIGDDATTAQALKPQRCQRCAGYSHGYGYGRPSASEKPCAPCAALAARGAKAQATSSSSAAIPARSSTGKPEPRAAPYGHTSKVRCRRGGGCRR